MECLPSKILKAQIRFGGSSLRIVKELSSKMWTDFQPTYCPITPFHELHGLGNISSSHYGFHAFKERLTLSYLSNLLPFRTFL
jgi:hypothetical protein